MRESNGWCKCVVWDLDNTIWTGILLEEDVALKDNIISIIKTLDNRGILQSISSKSNYDSAINKLDEFGIIEYFLYPQINWNSKLQSINKIAELLRIGLDSMVFIDDDCVEIDEVKYFLPEVICINAKKLPQLLDMSIMNPRFVTEDLKNRRQLYLTEIKRKQVEEEFIGPKEKFLKSLNMTLVIFSAEEKDLQRAEELTVRTNQLNATGYTYTYDELNDFRQSKEHKLLMAKLDDKYGSYGHIGLMLVNCQGGVWVIKLLLMSCRVMTRGVGSIMLNHVMHLAKKANVRLQAEFVPNDRNRIMSVTYRFAGFCEVEKRGKIEILQHNMENVPSFPDYMKVIVS